MTLGKKSKLLLPTMISVAMLLGGCSSSGDMTSHKALNVSKTKSKEACNNIPLISSEKNINTSFIDSFPQPVKNTSKNTTGEPSQASNTIDKHVNSPEKAQSTSAPQANDSNNISNIGSEKNTKNSIPKVSYTTDTRGIIRDKSGLIVGVKTEATTFGSGTSEDSSKFKKSNISTVGIDVPKNFEIPKFYVDSQNVFDPELTTGYVGINYTDKNSLNLTMDDQKNIDNYNNIISHNVSIANSYSETDCRVNFKKVTINSGDHGARIHVSPSFSSASYGVAANYSNIEGYYINSGWFRITSGPLKYGYVSAALIGDSRIKNGEIPSAHLAKIPDYLRQDPKSTSSEYLNPVAARQLILMNAAYRKVFHSNLKLNEGYRPLSTQEEYWKSLPNGVAAKPGTSNHGMALAMDINNVIFQNTQDRWLSLYSQMFGWDRPDYFDRGGSERWHYNFIG